MSFEEQRVRLIQTLEQKLQHTLETRLRQAFLTVPRHLLVPTHITQVEPGEWREQDASAVVYQDRPLITKLSPGRLPSSSSSAPSLMAGMLEALDLAPGLRVLEIGTGTGYNAALLSEIVGISGQVVSVDIDSNLVELAQLRLKNAGYSNIQVATANGLLGFEQNAPYDRIIATGCVTSIPSAWRSQLVSSGIALGSLKQGRATPLFQLFKQRDGTLHGTLLSIPASFMSLYTDSPPAFSRIDFSAYDALPLVEEGNVADTLVGRIMEPYDASLAQFLSFHLPGMELYMRYLGGASTLRSNVAQILILDGTMLSLVHPDEHADFWKMTVRGTVPLWSQITTLIDSWEHSGRPSLEQYEIYVDQQGKSVFHISNSFS
jgi:protein-L-isoaspartate(D-aspartate) O-methyltransferase